MKYTYRLEGTEPLKAVLQFKVDGEYRLETFTGIEQAKRYVNKLVDEGKQVEYISFIEERKILALPIPMKKN